MAKLCTLFSGSKANCTYIASAYGGILIDVGASAIMTERALKEIGIEPDTINGIFITHEHSDHIKGVGAFARKFGITVYSSAATLTELENKGALCGVDSVSIENASTTEVGGLQIMRFSTSHDAVDSGGYRITLPDGSAVAVCTDLGIVTDSVKNALLGCSSVVLESNHDIKMLEKGPYPPELKLRIAGEKGHLSNGASASLSAELLKSGTVRFILSHLSENNNSPMLAASCTEATFKGLGATKNDYILKVAPPKSSEILYI